MQPPGGGLSIDPAVCVRLSIYLFVCLRRLHCAGTYRLEPFAASCLCTQANTARVRTKLRSVLSLALRSLQSTVRVEWRRESEREATCVCVCADRPSPQATMSSVCRIAVCTKAGANVVAGVSLARARRLRRRRRSLCAGRRAAAPTWTLNLHWRDAAARGGRSGIVRLACVGVGGGSSSASVVGVSFGVSVCALSAHCAQTGDLCVCGKTISSLQRQCVCSKSRSSL